MLLDAGAPANVRPSIPRRLAKPRVIRGNRKVTETAANQSDKGKSDKKPSKDAGGRTSDYASIRDRHERQLPV
jgi:hypothetical protein